MKYVLVFWWSYLSGADSSVHTSVYAYTFDTHDQCLTIGEAWLALPPQLQRPIAYTCEPGNTEHERRLSAEPRG